MSLGVSASTLFLVAQGAGAGMSALGAYNSAKAQKATLGYEAAVADNNAKIAEYQSKLAIEQGQIAEQNQRLKTANLYGDQRAALAANGVDLGTGSATEILATTKYMGERDALTVRDNAAREAWAFELQAQGYRADAAVDRANADAINPTMAAVSSLLGSGSQVAGSWYKYSKTQGG